MVRMCVYNQLWLLNKLQTCQTQLNCLYILFFLCLCSSFLCDVILKSEDGKEFSCHKSVLCARLGKMNQVAFKSIKTVTSVCFAQLCMA